MRVYKRKNCNYVVVDCLDQAQGRVLKNECGENFFANYLFAVPDDALRMLLKEQIDHSEFAGQSIDLTLNAETELRNYRANNVKQSLSRFREEEIEDGLFVLEFSIFGGTQNFYIDMRNASVPEIRYIGDSMSAHAVNSPSHLLSFDDGYTNPELGDR